MDIGVLRLVLSETPRPFASLRVTKSEGMTVRFMPYPHVTRVTKDCNYVTIYYLMGKPPVNENGFALRKSEAQ